MSALHVLRTNTVSMPVSIFRGVTYTSLPIDSSVSAGLTGRKRLTITRYATRSLLILGMFSGNLPGRPAAVLPQQETDGLGSGGDFCLWLADFVAVKPRLRRALRWPRDSGIS
jgi:hypothetical protein